ncbi:hypothetical protein [Mycoplasma suis]|uniref:Uncharacterized protein n=1 Tax=Mycoplasma suis (strain Illinois) TaxID=768700 RepID=F0QS74_MYCSL|nr:hypothetical protein [Mycoplasma suis]ADX98344.1 hypothetical protein MSU_0823 [Mycoplasma suis str. Illinois]
MFLYGIKVFLDEFFVKKGGIFRKEREELNEVVKRKLIDNRVEFNKHCEKIFKTYKEIERSGENVSEEIMDIYLTIKKAYEIINI